MSEYGSSSHSTCDLNITGTVLQVKNLHIPEKHAYSTSIHMKLEKIIKHAHKYAKKRKCNTIMIDRDSCQNSRAVRDVLRKKGFEIHEKDSQALAMKSVK